MSGRRRYSYSIAAAYGEDAIMVPEGPLVSPGTYQVKLNVDGHNYTSTVEVKMDPRVRVTTLALNQQLALEMKIIAAMQQSLSVLQEVKEVRTQLTELRTRLSTDANAKSLLDSINSLDKEAAEFMAVEQTYPPVGIVSAAALNGALGSLLTLVESADAAPTAQAASTFVSYNQLLDQQMAKWAAVKTKDIPALNSLLRQRQLPPIKN
jgi:hypothetical protein